MDGLNALFGVALLIAGLAAIAAPRHVGAAWCLIASTWVVTVLCFDESTSPLFGLARLGIYLSMADLSSIMDGLTAVAIINMSRENWAVQLYAALFGQALLHAGYQYAGLPYLVYNPLLDALFLAQLAVIINAGGKGLANVDLRCLLPGLRGFFAGRA